jgi:predicted TIM-barrel fold metal-dependent hydrolase
MDEPLISVDDHVVEPPHVWTSRLPLSLREAAPRVERRRLAHSIATVGGRQVARSSAHGAVLGEAAGDSGTGEAEGLPCDWWIFEDKAIPLTRHAATIGFERMEMNYDGVTYDEIHDGCYTPEGRLRDMDVDGVEVSLMFGSVAGVAGQPLAAMRDKELAAACVGAYNDWFYEEWTEPSGGRMLPVALLPLWDVDACAAEVRRNAARGILTVGFPDIPAKLGLPSLHSGHWDPFFATCQETGTTVSMHIGSSGRPPKTSDDMPMAVMANVSCMNSILGLSDWLFSGVLVRFPELKFFLGEAQVGWIPYFLERADTVWERQKGWTDVDSAMSEPPTTYLGDRFFASWVSDRTGVLAYETIGRYTTFGTDYPHTNTWWPNTHKTLERYMEGIPESVIRMILRENGLRLIGRA